MNRKQFLQTVAATSIALIFSITGLSQNKKAISDEYMGKADKIRRAMVSNTIPDSFPKFSNHKTKKEFKAAVIIWVSKNKHLIIPKHLAEFENKMNIQK